MPYLPYAYRHPEYWQKMMCLGIPTEFHVYKGLDHGFGIGTGTVAEGWILDAIRFWERQMENGV